MQNLFIDQILRSVHETNGSFSAPQLWAMQGTRFELSVGFMTNCVAEALPAGTPGKLVFKKPLDFEGAVLLADTAWTLVGSGSAARYVFSLLADSEELVTYLTGRDRCTLGAQIEWQLAGETEPRRSLPFTVDLINSYHRSTDGLPTASLFRAFAWLVETLLPGTNVGFAINDATKRITINAAGGGGGGTADHGGLIGLGDDDHTHYYNQTRGDARYSQLGHTHTKSQVGLSLADNTSDATKQSAVLTAAALQFISFAAAQSLSQPQRRQAMANSGVDVTLHAELIAPYTAVGIGSYYAVTLPRNFRMHAAYLTTALDTETGALLTGALNREDPDGSDPVGIATLTGSAVTNGVLVITDSADVVLSAGQRIVLTLSGVSAPYSGAFSGLQLWLHGFWV